MPVETVCGAVRVQNSPSTLKESRNYEQLRLLKRPLASADRGSVRVRLKRGFESGLLTTDAEVHWLW